MPSRFLHSDNHGPTLEKLTKFFGFDQMMLSNTGTEAGEAILKFARKWAYDIKGVKENEARVLFAHENFWGRSIAACGSSDDPHRYAGFGPFGLNFDIIEYNNIKAFENYLKENSKNLAAYYVEAIQGDGGINIPDPGYFSQVRQLCDEHKVLLMIDEVQTGMGRTGKLLANHHDNIRVDAITVGKGFGGGYYPVSGVLASNEVMNLIGYGQHGSTYAASSMACAMASVMVDIVQEENLVENSRVMGEYLLAKLKELRSPLLKEVRGRGLIIGIE